MKEPSKKAINEVLQAQQERMAQMNKVSIDTILIVRKYTDGLLEKIAKAKKPEKYYQQIEDYMIQQYGDLYHQYKEQIVNSLNESGIEQRHLVEVTLQQPIIWKPLELYKVLPTSQEFKITNKILSEKSILRRSKVLSNRVTSLLSDGFNKGESIQQIQRRLDIELGFRDKTGALTAKSRELIKQGKFAHANGHIYQNYRIARTETARMAHIQQYKVYDSLDRDDKRLKLLSVIDKRTRKQSAEMNGQVSNLEGQFKYPDGKFYKLGYQPSQWSIMDRETSYIVFID